MNTKFIIPKRKSPLVTNWTSKQLCSKLTSKTVLISQDSMVNLLCTRRITLDFLIEDSIMKEDKLFYFHDC